MRAARSPMVKRELLRVANFDDHQQERWNVGTGVDLLFGKVARRKHDAITSLFISQQL